MSEREELNRRIDVCNDALSRKVEQLQAEVESYNSYIQLLLDQKGTLERYGAQIPAVMQATELIIHEIAAAVGIEVGVSVENPPPEDVARRVITLRPRTRRIITPDIGTDTADSRRGTHYNIAPQVKPVMNGIFGSGKEGVPQNLESVFEGVYGPDWHLRQLLIPDRPGSRHRQTTYGDDLLSPNSYLKRLVKGADEIINTRMRVNTNTNWEFRGKVAARELMQLFNMIGDIGWDVYDGFMIRNGIR